MFEKQLLLLIDLERLLGPCPNNLKRIIVLWKRLLFSKWIWKIFKIVKIINPKVWPWNGQGEKNRFSLKQHISGQSSFTSHIWRKHESSGIIYFIQKKKKSSDVWLCTVPCLVQTKHNKSAQTPHTNRGTQWWRGRLFLQHSIWASCMYTKVFHSEIWGHLYNCLSLAKNGSRNRIMVSSTIANLMAGGRKKTWLNCCIGS